jgi:hypothetical protein
VGQLVVTDWANISLFGQIVILGSFIKMKELAKILGYLFPYVEKVTH